jgi:hypothetical protein
VDVSRCSAPESVWNVVSDFIVVSVVSLLIVLDEVVSVFMYVLVVSLVVGVLVVVSLFM